MIACTIVFWAAFAILTGFVHTSWQLLAIRFILGVAEGGVYPAILALISHWFPNQERARAIAYFQMNLAVASIITSPLSGWLIELHGWRQMFVIEGVLSLALLFVWVPMVAGQYWFAKRCDATMNRRLYTALPFIGFALCLFLSILLQQNMWMSYGMMVICGFFLQAYAGPFWTLLDPSGPFWCRPSLMAGAYTR